MPVNFLPQFSDEIDQLSHQSLSIQHSFLGEFLLRANNMLWGFTTPTQFILSQRNYSDIRLTNTYIAGILRGGLQSPEIDRKVAASHSLTTKNIWILNGFGSKIRNILIACIRTSQRLETTSIICLTMGYDCNAKVTFIGYFYYTAIFLFLFKYALLCSNFMGSNSVLVSFMFTTKHSDSTIASSKMLWLNDLATQVKATLLRECTLKETLRWALQTPWSEFLLRIHGQILVFESHCPLRGLRSAQGEQQNFSSRLL